MKAVMLLAALAIGTAHADTRVQRVTYSPDRIYDVYTQVGRATVVQFEADESLTSSDASAIGLGDADAWKLDVRGNNVIFKPSAKLPRTNLVIVTNKRTYLFDLLETPKGEAPTYIMRFRYPDSEAKAAAKKAEQDALLASHKRAPAPSINTDYVWKGSAAALAPTAAFDDGRFTRLVYDHAGEVPVFYRALPDGTEAMINSHIDGNTVVFHELVRVAKARLGDKVIEIINRSYRRPSFNEAGTSEPGSARIDKDQ